MDTRDRVRIFMVLKKLKIKVMVVGNTIRIASKNLKNGYFAKNKNGFQIVNSDLIAYSQNESIFWTLSMFISSKLGDSGIEGLR